MEWLLLVDYEKKPGGSATVMWTKSITQASPQALFSAYSLQKDCKGKSLTLKYFFHLWKHYIKQSRVQGLTLLLGMLVFSSPLLACNNGKLHKVRKWDQHKVQINFHIKGLAQLFLQRVFNDIFIPVTRLRLQALSGNVGRLSILAGKGVLVFVFLCQKEMAVITQFREARCYILPQKDRNHRKRNLFPLNTKSFSNLLYHRQAL